MDIMDGMIGTYHEFIENDNLKSHLLPNLKTNGIPNELKNTTFSFIYNDFDSL